MNKVDNSDLWAAPWFAIVPINHDIIRVSAGECLFSFEDILCAHFSTLD